MSKFFNELTWNEIKWGNSYKIVRRLQRRIFRLVRSMTEVSVAFAAKAYQKSTRKIDCSTLELLHLIRARIRRE